MRAAGGFFFGFVVLLSLLLSQMTATRATIAEPQRGRSRPARAKVAPKPRVDYAHFSHSTHVSQQKLACDSCHKFPSKNWKIVRKADEAFQDVTEFPEHSSCLACHREQFFARERPAPIICSNCHVAITPRNTARLVFPSLGNPFWASKAAEKFVSEFVVAFPHDKHVDVVSRNLRDLSSEQKGFFVNASYRFYGAAADEQPKSCPVCHQTYNPQGKSNDEFVTKPPKGLSEEAFWLKKGTFKTTPSSHTVCFTCHNAEAELEPLPNKCASCHKLRTTGTSLQHDFDPALAKTMGITDPIMLTKWSRRSAIRFRHEFDVHADLSCTTCHNPAVMNTLQERTLVSVKSCGGEGSGCHVESNTDGILNFEIEQKKTKPDFQCTKCHVNLGKQAVPADHLEALPKAEKK